MTRSEFVERATREAEKRLSLPAGWWGTWCDVYAPDGTRVRFSSFWMVTAPDGTRTKHDSRAAAIAKARKAVPRG